MSNPIVIHRGRECRITVNLGINVSADTLTSQIRTEPNSTSTLIATFTVGKVGGGTTGELVLSLTSAITGAITQYEGFMDIKRIVSTVAVPVFDRPLEVVFRDVVTA